MLKRLPLTGTYNTRPGSGALTGALAIAGIAVAGLAIAGNANQGSSKDHRLLNCLQITATDELTRSKKLRAVKRPGFAASTTPAAGSIGNAIHVWTGFSTGVKVMSCFGATNSTLYDGTTSKGALTGRANGITETSVSGTPTLAMCTSDSTGWYYQDGGSATKISDGDFPGNASRTLVGNFAHHEGWSFVMDSVGRIYNSDVNSITGWTAGSFITANDIPDVGVGCVTHGDTIVAFCKTHLEVFRNIGTQTGSPLERMDEYTKKVGCVSADAITELRGTIYFVGADEGGTLGLYSYNGGQVQPFVNPEVSAALEIVGPSNISLSVVGFFGRRFIAIIASSSTFLYCLEENNWHEWNGVPLWYKTAAVVSGSTIVVYSISKISTSGKVYVLNPAAVVYADDGIAYTPVIQTSKWDGGTELRKFMAYLRLTGDRQSGSTVYVVWSDDDYETWSMPRSITMSSRLLRTTRCGSFYQRAFRISQVGTVGMSLEALNLDVELGTT